LLFLESGGKQSWHHARQIEGWTLGNAVHSGWHKSRCAGHRQEGEERTLKYWRRFFRDEEAASAVEYGLLVALIAAIIILAVQGLGITLNTVFTNVNSALGSAGGS
jgi:pilus assembly protein Flp/PilA